MKPTHTLLFALLAIAAGGCASHSPRQVSNETQGVNIVFQGHVELDDYRLIEFSITNDLPRSVWIAGYSLQLPAYEIKYLKHGRWEDYGAWCAVGLKMLEIPSHSGTTFKVFIGELKGKTIRVGVRCFPEEDYTKVAATEYWSDEVKANR